MHDKTNDPKHNVPNSSDTNSNDLALDSEAAQHDARVTAAVLGQLDDAQRQQFEGDLQVSPELRREYETLRQVADALSHQHAAEPLVKPSLDLRTVLEARLQDPQGTPPKAVGPANPGRWWNGRTVATLAVTACLVLLLAIPVMQARRKSFEAPRLDVAHNMAAESSPAVVPANESRHAHPVHAFGEESAEKPSDDLPSVVKFSTGETGVEEKKIRDLAATVIELTESVSSVKKSADSKADPQPIAAAAPASKSDSLSVTLTVPTGPTPVAAAPIKASPATQMDYTHFDVFHESQLRQSQQPLQLHQAQGLQRGEIPAAGEGFSVAGTVVWEEFRQPAPSGYGLDVWATVLNEAIISQVELRFDRHPADAFQRDGKWYYRAPVRQPTQETYAEIVENPFVAVRQQPLSTFAVDVDTASYANVRRFLSQNQRPPVNAVRIEELINYFSYDYPQPAGEHPFATHLEVTECPWQPQHRLVRVGLQGKTIPRPERPGCNLVFLLDVSGSMKDSNKLPLLKQAMKLLVDQLDENDRVAIVTYASQAGLRLKSTVGDQRDVIRDAINGLNASGSTNGGAGIQLAYEQAQAGAIEGGVNRVILATDGDLNVGITDDDALVRLIKEQAADDVFLTVLGFGEGNLKDAKLEKLADNGDGHYAYIDTLREARKVLVEQVEGSLVTIAKDVKIKVEFNPAEVQGYRLIGYENRLMTAAEFNDDQKDAGEIGSGHSVTALYEIVPAAPAQLASAESLKYQQSVAPPVPDAQLSDAAKTGELLTLSLRYKLPTSDESTLVEFPLLNARKRFSEASLDLRFASAVASFGMLLRNSAYRGDTSFAAVEEIASAAIGSDEKGYRTEFLDLVRQAASVIPPQAPVKPTPVEPTPVEPTPVEPTPVKPTPVKPEGSSEDQGE